MDGPIHFLFQSESVLFLRCSLFDITGPRRHLTMDQLYLAKTGCSQRKVVTELKSVTECHQQVARGIQRLEESQKGIEVETLADN